MPLLHIACIAAWTISSKCPTSSVRFGDFCCEWVIKRSIGGIYCSVRTYDLVSVFTVPL